MDTLRDLGLVEVVGKTDSGGSIPADIYAIIDRGEEFAESSAWRTYPTAEEVDRLRDRVDELEKEWEETEE